MQITLPKLSLKALVPSFASQWFLWVAGVIVPFYLILTGNWLISTAGSLVDQVKSYLDVVAAEAGKPFIYEKVLIPLSANGGVWYMVIGVLLFILAGVLFMFAFRRAKAMGLELAKVNVYNLILGLFVGLMLGMLVIAVLNYQLFGTLIALQGAA